MTDPSVTVRARRRRIARRQVVAASSACLLLVGVGAAAPANAAFSGVKIGSSNFEIDNNANFTQDNGSPSIDWLLSDKTTTRGVNTPDKVNGTGDNSFGKGTAEDDPVPSVTTDSIPPNKSDLLAFGSYQETVGNSSYLHLLWTRVQDPSGSTNMDFEFDQASRLSSNGVTPLRTPGDLLLEYHLANGGSLVTLTRRTWAGSSWNASQVLSGNAIGSINSSPILAADAGPFGAKSARTFGEASIDLSTIFPGGTCESFGYAYLKSRSSDSFSSEIKDFTTPAAVNVTNCGTVSIHKQDEAGTPLSGAVFTLYNNVAPLTAPRTDADTVTSPALTCTTLSTGDCSIVNVPFGNYWVVETVTPANHDTAADQAVSVAPAGNTPSGTFTFVDPRQQGSIMVQKTDENGAALSGAGFTITPGNVVMSPVAGSPGLFCTDQLPYGQYTVTESTIPFGYTGASAQSFTVSTKSTCAVRLASAVQLDLTFVNNPKLGTINVLKTDDATPGNPLGGAQFTLYRDVAPTGSYGAGDTVVQAGPNTTSGAGTTQFTTVPLGDYCVVETYTPLTYDTAPAQCVTIGLAANGQTVPLTFVDPRQRGSILVMKVDGNGVALAGAGFTVSQGATSVGTMTQLSTGVFCLDGLLTGTYTVTESTVPAGYAGQAPKTFAVSSNSSCVARIAGTVTADLTFVNTPVPGRIDLTKRDDAGNLLANAGFTLYQDAGTIGSYDPLVDTAVQAGPLSTSASGTLSFTNVPLGNYCVVETSTPSAYTTAPAQCVTVFLGSTAGTGSTLNLSFEDPRQHTVIVIVCHQGTNTLDSSPVTLGAATKDSLASAPSGITEAQLCGLGGATYSVNNHGVKGLSVDVR